MPKIKYDVDGVEDSFAVPTPNLYRAVITDETALGKSKAGNSMITVVLKISKGDFSGAKLWHYIVLDDSVEAHRARLKQFLSAAGVLSSKQKGSFDLDALEGTELQVRVKNEEYEGDTKAKVVGLYPLLEDEDEEEFDDPNEEEDEEGEEEESESGEDEDDESDDAEEDESEDEEETEDEESYEDWSLAELKEELANRDLKTTGKKSALVTRLEKDDENSGLPF